MMLNAQNVEGVAFGNLISRLNSSGTRQSPTSTLGTVGLLVIPSLRRFYSLPDTPHYLV